MLILGIESSCDETAASICNDGVIMSNIVLSQEIHQEFGGVVPEIASREHDSRISSVVDNALLKANISYKNIDAIAVTYGAGLMGALLIGLNYAKGLSIALNVPFIGVNHLEGHLYASFISTTKLNYPYLCFLVTGGHTQIWEVQSEGNYILHSNTMDDAAGEAFDKGARILGLPYPGGPQIEKTSLRGDRDSYKFSIPKVKSNPLNFSFSGMKTSLLYKYNLMSPNEQKNNIYNLAASYQEGILNSLFTQLSLVVSTTGIKQVSIVGGVAANKRFRELSQIMQVKSQVSIFFPPIEYCTDNAAMIATAGYKKLKQGLSSSLELKANPSLALNDKSSI